MNGDEITEMESHSLFASAFLPMPAEGKGQWAREVLLLG